MSRRVLMGQWPAGVGSGFGLRVSLPGRDAASADDRDLTFSSDWPAVLPEHASGTFSFNNNTQGVATYPDLGYTPFAFFLFQPLDNPSNGPFLDGWNVYSTAGPFIRAYRDHVVAEFALPAGSTGYQTGFQVAFIVYRMRAN